MELRRLCRDFFHIGIEQKPFHREFLLYQLPHVEEGSGVILVVVIADHAATDHSTKSIHALQGGIERLATDIIEVHVNALGAGLVMLRSDRHTFCN